MARFARPICGSGEYGQAKLLGFPLAQDPLGAPQMRLEAQADSLAPELAQGPPVRPMARSDVYSLNWHALSPVQPVIRCSAAATCRRSSHANARETPALEQVAWPCAPPALIQVLTYTLNKNPEQRYQQVAALVQASLALYLDGENERTDAATQRPTRDHENLAQAANGLGAARGVTAAGLAAVHSQPARGQWNGRRSPVGAPPQLAARRPSPAAVATIARPLRHRRRALFASRRSQPDDCRQPVAAFPAFQPAPLVHAERQRRRSAG